MPEDRATLGERRAARAAEMEAAKTTVLTFLEQTVGWHDARSISRDTAVPHHMSRRLCRNLGVELLPHPKRNGAFKLMAVATEEDLRGEIAVQEEISVQAQERVRELKDLLGE